MKTTNFLVVAVLATCFASAVVAQERREHPTKANEPAARSLPAAAQGTPEAAVDAFFRALLAGDAQAAQSWLASDVLIYESGHAEHSRAQYLREHLPADMKALSGARITSLERQGSAVGDLAWVASRVRMQRADGKPGAGSVSTETMVLQREAGGWRIRHIHWSSSSH